MAKQITPIDRAKLAIRAATRFLGSAPQPMRTKDRAPYARSLIRWIRDQPERADVHIEDYRIAIANLAAAHVATNFAWGHPEVHTIREAARSAALEALRHYEADMAAGRL